METNHNQLMLALKEFVVTKIQVEQNGIPTIFDNAILQAINTLKEHTNDKALLFLQRTNQLIGRIDSPRFLPPINRITEMNGSDIPYFTRVCSQGTRTCMTWRGKPIFKNVFDLAVYQMLVWEQRPKTIIEIGTGESLKWFHAQQLECGIEGVIVGVDKKKHSYDKGINYIQGDVENISSLLPHNLLSSLPKPWLVVEDVHVNVLGILEHISPFVVPGDYIVVEDSIHKQETIVEWLNSTDREFLIDSKFVDFFGVNSTSSPNSIFICSS